MSNAGGNSLTEINASDGSLVRTVSGADYGFNNPKGIVFDGTYLWVTNASGNTVTEVFAR